MKPGQRVETKNADLSTSSGNIRACRSHRVVGRSVSRRSYGVMVSTYDSKSYDPGSNPGRTFLKNGDD